MSLGPNPTLKTLKHLLGILSTFFKGGDAKQTQARLGLLCGDFAEKHVCNGQIPRQLQEGC